MDIVSANINLSSSYQLDVKSATVSAGNAAPSQSGPAQSPAPSAAPAVPAPAKSGADAYLGSVPTSAFDDHRMKRWLARLEHKLEKGDEAGAEKQIEKLLGRIAHMLERPGTDAIRQASQGDSAAPADAAVTGSAVQVHDEAKVSLSLSFQTADGNKFSIDAALDVSRDFARQQVTVSKAA
jgi:hypothetical protein